MSGKHTAAEHRAMALVRRERDETPEDGGGRHRVVDMVQRRKPGTHMDPRLKKGATEKA